MQCKQMCNTKSLFGTQAKQKRCPRGSRSLVRSCPKSFLADMTTEPATKRRKVVAPKRTGAAAKKAAGPSKQDIKECKEGIAQWFPLTSDADATFDSLKDIDTWRAYFKMRDLCPGMPLVVLEKGGEGDDDEEDDAEEAEAEETDENKAVKPSNVDAADAEPAAKTSDGAGSPDKKAPPVATKDADEAAAAPSVTEEEATVTAEAADDADDDDASVRFHLVCSCRLLLPAALAGLRACFTSSA